MHAEMELEGKEKEREAMAEDEEEAKIPKAAQPKLESRENAEDNESGSTDSGQENSGETRLLRSGTYSDRTESKAYGSVTHKCEVRAAGATAGLPFLGATGITVISLPVGLRKGVHPHWELQAAHPHPHRREALLLQGVQ